MRITKLNKRPIYVAIVNGRKANKEQTTNHKPQTTNHYSGRGATFKNILFLPLALI